ncbi:MAG: PBP1b-binding outer membrane lipoprotein LpoB [Sphingobacteriales bacterium]|jgi:PBP1b-binding outer membrane lipoprotein LpoB
MKNALLIIFCLFLSAGCGDSSNDKKSTTNSPNKEIKKSAKPKVLTARDVYTDALIVHDRIMPQMNEIGELRTDLEAMVQRGKFDDSMASEVDEIIKKLQKAHDDMMFWMEYVQEVDYHLDTDSFSDHEKMEEASTMKAEIKRIEKDFKSSIAKAKSLMINV